MPAWVSSSLPLILLGLFAAGCGESPSDAVADIRSKASTSDHDGLWHRLSPAAQGKVVELKDRLVKLNRSADQATGPAKVIVDGVRRKLLTSLGVSSTEELDQLGPAELWDRLLQTGPGEEWLSLYSKAEVAGSSISSEDSNRATVKLSVVREGESKEMEISLVRKGGRWLFDSELPTPGE